MPRHNVALYLPHPLPSLPIEPPPTPSPLQQVIASTLSTTDYDHVSLPLTNAAWQARWEKLCLRPIEEEGLSEEELERRAIEERKVDQEADVWRRDGGLKRSEVVVSRLEESQGVIPLASEWLELDSPDEGIRFDSELALRAEFAHALYLSLPVLILPAPSLANRAFLPSYARAICNLLQMGGQSAVTNISIRIPVSNPLELIAPESVMPNGLAGSHSPVSPPSASGARQMDKKHKRLSSLSTRPQSMQTSLFGQPANQGTNQNQQQGMRIASGASSLMSANTVYGSVAGSGQASLSVTAHGGDLSSTWEMWDCIRTLCGYHPRLSVTLDLTNPLPPSAGALARWSAEPVNYIWLPASSFIPNAKGYPVLSKACQAFIREMGKQNPTYILSQTTMKRHSAGGHNAYLQYIRHITSTPQPGPNTQPRAIMALPAGASEKFQDYSDYLQAPLQPLMDDLGSMTYNIFENDPVKYAQYETAITQALLDLPANKKHVMTVVGAGRGPLVDCALRALLHSGRQASIYAVEKNTNAFVTLQERKELEWRDKVHIINGDMRVIDVPEKCDILVSELLGSFGDNELSPECLDGALRLMKSTGISIPSSYTAHIAPLSTSKLYQETRSPSRGPSSAETPYVVMLSQVDPISGDNNVPGVSPRCGERIQQCWQFVHPNRDITVDSNGIPLSNSHNARASTHTFHIPHAATLHGFGGYFEAHLYGDVGLSIHPENAHAVSPDLTSWFPLFFPLKEPMYLPSGSELQVNLWRMGDGKGKKVWYEWAVESYLPVVQSVSSAPGAVTVPGSRNVSSASGSGTGFGGQPSPLMDAPFSPGMGHIGLPGGLGRVKIGQSTLHNPGGIHSWVGL
ncbi:protein arginine N-methyltransferase 5 [Cryptococcus gattii E566]|uniref:Protein arginine N-methyltransferase n=2 Tax=Cryptococcus gattii TaxID=37769 RepID=E6R1T4_CRYGW|nr:shk1 kinase-binding protein 1, putative [Cryptococcus gattii WM276]ADV21175.1 shk1 kinase-binding protein 1, putative [Cryptococcus gattii WM276]KIR81691.1 protein arginine N-methyltransferase 5 [Cryptococcus gattii EJB2]KIY36738.1 protein arginine N-methyltransferase 5 [Cryptococcus gattii E566]KJE01970.1 protein arginine N-methyltransferase 5 [Cryptococcus gattii NT-10]